MVACVWQLIQLHKECEVQSKGAIVTNNKEKAMDTRAGIDEQESSEYVRRKKKSETNA